ncbi:zinc finger protein 436-like isoform X2 [Schistocerca gregaria]|uniref:zinc finger protein 436-like isoform X2 n=1 Tax=Schistocerca gregaria TaxID=7010 RepID=UPI00211DCD34|nr:zinc finger protein 436-like isoform X2 [Schistocerca gregaria]
MEAGLPSATEELGVMTPKTELREHCEQDGESAEPEELNCVTVRSEQPDVVSYNVRQKISLPRKQIEDLPEIEPVSSRTEGSHINRPSVEPDFVFVGVKQEPLEDREADEFLLQEPECIIMQGEDPCHDTLQTGALRPRQEPECIIVQKEVDDVRPRLLETTQVHENGARQKPARNPGGGAEEEEEMILGLEPEIDWVLPVGPASDEPSSDPLASEREVIPDSMNEGFYPTGWSHTSDENRRAASGEADYDRSAFVSANGGGPSYGSFISRSYRSDGKETVQQAFRCDSCSAIFSTKYHLVNHVFVHIREVPPPSHVCRRCGEVFCDTASLIDHSKGHENNLRVPAVSSKWNRGDSGRPSEHQKKRRIRKRPDTKPHVCDLCGKAFPLVGSLKSHQRTHSGERPYGCDLCGKTFVQAVHLRNHRVTHTAEKRHYCEFCGRPFALLHTLKVHLRMHTGENPYRCEMCGECFNLLGKLKTHKQIHTGKKPYKCDDCGNCFSAPNSLRRHRRMHSGERPYSCDVCGESFMWSATLQRHRQLHTGEKPFKCDLCGSSFAELGGLNRHMRIHTGERPYACRICGASFSATNQLKRHLHRQHVENPP